MQSITTHCPGCGRSKEQDPAHENWIEAYMNGHKTCFCTRHCFWNFAGHPLKEGE